MTATNGDAYLAGVLRRYAVQVGPNSPGERAGAQVVPHVRAWAGQRLRELWWSGSYAKGTAVAGNTDIDVFVSLKHDAGTIKSLYAQLAQHLRLAGFTVRPQNVSLGLTVGRAKVDVVPGRKQAVPGGDHTLYARKRDSWLQTNPEQHVSTVKNSGAADEIRLTKIWRNLHRVELPSFYLELSVIEALRGRTRGQLEHNFLRVFEYLRDEFVGRRIVDPANANNIVSDELTRQEKQAVASQASVSLGRQYWSDIVW